MAKRGGFPGGGMPGNMANLMKQAQKMQRQMEEDGSLSVQYSDEDDYLTFKCVKSAGEE